MRDDQINLGNGTTGLRDDRINFRKSRTALRDGQMKLSNGCPAWGGQKRKNASNLTATLLEFLQFIFAISIITPRRQKSLCPGFRFFPTPLPGHFACASQKSPGNPGFGFPVQDNHITARPLPGDNSPLARFSVL